MSPERIAHVLGVRVEEVPHHLVTLPAWDPRPAPGRSCVRLTAFVRSARGLRAVVFEAPTETDALARLCAEGIA
ncbi:MAG: hypothetical protein R3A48_28550 [Polyangiales bacterium]